MKKYIPTEFAFQVSEYTISYKSLSKERHKITSSATAYDLINPYFQEYHGVKEAVYVMYLNRNNVVIGIQRCGEGGLTGCVIDPRIVLRPAIELLCSYMIIFHNHPSENLTPSTADRDITEKIRNAAKFFDIALLDHMIVTESGFYSFSDEGII